MVSFTRLSVDLPPTMLTTSQVSVGNLDGRQPLHTGTRVTLSRGRAQPPVSWIQVSERAPASHKAQVSEHTGYVSFGFGSLSIPSTLETSAQSSSVPVWSQPISPLARLAPHSPLSWHPKPPTAIATRVVADMPRAPAPPPAAATIRAAAARNAPPASPLWRHQPKPPVAVSARAEAARPRAPAQSRAAVPPRAAVAPRVPAASPGWPRQPKPPAAVAGRATSARPRAKAPPRAPTPSRRPLAVSHRLPQPKPPTVVAALPRVAKANSSSSSRQSAARA